MVKDDPTLQVPVLFGVPIGINLPAILIVLLITAILVKGTKDSTKMAGLMVFIKMAVIALFVFAGAFFGDASWVGTLMYFVGIFLVFVEAP